MRLARVKTSLCTLHVDIHYVYLLVHKGMYKCSNMVDVTALYVYLLMSTNFPYTPIPSHSNGPGLLFQINFQSTIHLPK